MPNVIQFPTRYPAPKNALAPDFTDETIYRVLLENDQWLGWPNVYRYEEHVEFFDDPAYPNVMLANIVVPEVGPRGLFYVDADTMKFVKLADEPMANGPIPTCVMG